MADLVSLKKSETTIKSWKGHVVPPTTTLDEVLTGVQVVQPIVISNPKKVKRKDFPADFKFGCSTSALQVSLSLSLTLSLSYKYTYIRVYIYMLGYKDLGLNVQNFNL